MESNQISLSFLALCSKSPSILRYNLIPYLTISELWILGSTCKKIRALIEQDPSKSRHLEYWLSVNAVSMNRGEVNTGMITMRDLIKIWSNHLVLKRRFKALLYITVHDIIKFQSDNEIIKKVNINVKNFYVRSRRVYNQTGNVIYAFDEESNKVWKYQIEDDCIVSMTEVQPMIHSRRSKFGCLYVPQAPGVIVVAGG